MEAFSHHAGLTGSPDESGNRRREKGLARAGNARVRRGMAGKLPSDGITTPQQCLPDRPSLPLLATVKGKSLRDGLRPPVTAAVRSGQPE